MARLRSLPFPPETYRLYEKERRKPREGQRPDRALPRRRGREDARQPDRALRGEGVRAHLHPADGGPRPPASHRRRDARLRSGHGPARPAADRGPRRDLAAAALAATSARRQEQGEVPEGPDEDDPPARALLEATLALPVQPQGEQ